MLQSNSCWIKRSKKRTNESVDSPSNSATPLTIVSMKCFTSSSSSRAKLLVKLPTNLLVMQRRQPSFFIYKFPSFYIETRSIELKYWFSSIVRLLLLFRFFDQFFSSFTAIAIINPCHFLLTENMFIVCSLVEDGEEDEKAKQKS